MRFTMSIVSCRPTAPASSPASSRARMISGGTETPGRFSCMNRAPFAVKSGATPTSTFARSRIPRARIISAHAVERLDVVGDLGPHELGARVQLGLQARGVVRIGQRHVRHAHQVAGRILDLGTAQRPARLPSCRASRTTSSTSRSFTTGASGWSPMPMGSPDRHRRLRAPSAQAPSSSDVMARRLRSRTVSCSVGSMPACATNAAPATADMCTLAAGLSVTFAAST